VIARAERPQDGPGAIAAFFGDLANALAAVQVSDQAGAAIEFAEGMHRAIDLIVARTSSGRKLMFVGNGASAAIASHQSADYAKTGGMRAMTFSDPALLTSVSNDLGYPAVFEKPVETFADPGDILMAISSSGRSENILRAARMAREKGCAIVTMSGFAPDNPLRSQGELNFYVPCKSYGHVEITHLSVSHCLLDSIVRLYGSPPKRG
jgi:D-sedoheptulose 7-phosphate isomerase